MLSAAETRREGGHEVPQRGHIMKEKRSHTSKHGSSAGGLAPAHSRTAASTERTAGRLRAANEPLSRSRPLRPLKVVEVVPQRGASLSNELPSD
ncbi:hypothetical protein KUCAC02_033657 [Chaenocephalus aceratus]|nr:hypothetical protein KUCAC02_033657 [Chaenocephalus aceratus]